MNFLILPILTLSWAVYSTFAADGMNPTPIPGLATSSPHPIYQDGITGYVPHATYPYADGYGPGYDGYLVVPSQGNQYPDVYGPSALTPTSKGALATTMRFLARVGLFLLGGIALLIVGGIFTTAVCSLTPLCTIHFAGFGQISKDTMRTLVNPDRIANAAAFVEDAVHKYNRLQRAING